MTAGDKDILFTISHLKKYFYLKNKSCVKAVDDISFQIYKGETLGLVGESGCGKTTTGRLILRAIEATSGSITFFDEMQPLEVLNLTKDDLLHFWEKVQLIFQDPYSSLNPRMTVMQIIEEPLRCLTNMSKKERQSKVMNLMKMVNLDIRFSERYPHAFSGGQRQRIGIARALASRPAMLVADEPVASLDVSVQAQIISLLEELTEKLGLTCLFISHDLGIVRHISQRVAVMYSGKIIEIAETDELYINPKHPYTEALMKSVPNPDPEKLTELEVLSGNVPDPANPPGGCRFHPRCKYSTDKCSMEIPELLPVSGSKIDHLCACHYSNQLQLSGI